MIPICHHQKIFGVCSCDVRHLPNYIASHWLRFCALGRAYKSWLSPHLSYLLILHSDPGSDFQNALCVDTWPSLPPLPPSKFPNTRSMCPDSQRLAMHVCRNFQNLQWQYTCLSVTPKLSVHLRMSAALAPSETPSNRSMSRVFHIKLLRQRASTSPLYFSHSNNVSSKFQNIERKEECPSLPSLMFLKLQRPSRCFITKTRSRHTNVCTKSKTVWADGDESCAVGLFTACQNETCSPVLHIKPPTTLRLQTYSPTPADKPPIIPKLDE